MLLNIGFDITVACPQPTPVVVKVLVEPAQKWCLRSGEFVTTSPYVALSEVADSFANRSLRGVLPTGATRMKLDALVEVSDLPDRIDMQAVEVHAAYLPPEALRYLKPSRYCESDLLSDFAWANFGCVSAGWQRVQAIMDYVHNHIAFSYQHASMTRTAVSAQSDRIGVCRDFAHLAIALCRAMNIPARYCNGYMGDIGVPFNPSPMDFNAWVEVYLSGQWWTFDARHNIPRIGRVVISRGMDAGDCAIIHTFGRHDLRSFSVTTAEYQQGIARAA